jgi:hypothetical protein
VKCFWRLVQRPDKSHPPVKFDDGLQNPVGPDLSGPPVKGPNKSGECFYIPKQRLWIIGKDRSRFCTSPVHQTFLYVSLNSTAYL